MSNHKTTGVIGTGSFGLAMATLLSKNSDVVMFCRSSNTADLINSGHTINGVKLDSNVRAIISPAEFCQSCRTIFPAIPSHALRSSIVNLSDYLRPSHYVIHCTKGFDVRVDLAEKTSLSRDDVKTMSEVIAEESSVVRIGCMSGPNLAREIIVGQPTATLIASEFTEVIDEGQQVLNSEKFFVFGSHDIIGAELAGALKNIFALGAGYLAGKGLGKNVQAMLITRGLHEIIHFGQAMGAKAEAFLGTAGIGDLIATATSEDSRNYRCGYLFGQGKSLEEAITALNEVAEGVRTLKIAHLLSSNYGITTPITTTLYNVIHKQYDFDTALEYLMRFPYARDVPFI